MRDYSTEFPYLRNFLGGYFHQDWKGHGDTADEVVRYYCNAERIENRYGAIADISRLLCQTETDSELQEALDHFGCAYDVRRAEGSIRDWLRHVDRLIRTSVNQGQLA